MWTSLVNCLMLKKYFLTHLIHHLRNKYMGTYFFLSGNHMGISDVPTYRRITSDDLTFCSGLKSDAFGFAELNCVSLNTYLDNHRKTYFTLGVATLGTPYFVSIPSYWYAS